MSENKNKQQDVFEDVDSIEIKVEKNKREFEPLPTKEWLLAKVTDIKKQTPTYEGWKPSLNWTFDLVGDGFQGRRIWLNTSLLAVPGCKLYTYYLEIMGMSDISDGSVIRPSEIKGKLCYIMVEASKKKKDKQVISNIKHYVHVKDEISQVVSETKTKETIKEKKVEKETDELNLEDINLDDL